MGTPVTNALALACKVLDRPHADPDDDLAVMARGVVRMHEFATRPDGEVRTQLVAHLRGIINHWNEFGPEHGLDELMTHASSYLASYEANAGTSERKPHLTMAPDEYASWSIDGWHEVCRNVDGFDGIGIRYLGRD